jgi:integrase
VDPWTPNQLRHSLGDRVRGTYGLDYAQAVLGHVHAKTTEIYAGVSFEKAAMVMKEIG